jgi:P27 family predicted phage terminase small subunit
MGRPRKPEELHELQGTRPHPTTVSEEPLQHSLPLVPKDLSPEAKRTYKKLVKVMTRRRHATEGDELVLEMLVRLLDRKARAVRKLEEQGEVREYVRLDCHGEQCPVEKPNHWLKIAQDTEKQILACCDRLGLSATSRKSIRKTQQEKPPEPIDPNEALLTKPEPELPAEEPPSLDDIDENEAIHQ